MSYQVIVQPPAETDIEEAVAWIAQYSPEKAALWYFDLTEAIESLENFPARCPIAPESEEFGYEIRHLIFGKYRILFTIKDEAVRVFHIRHVRRRPLSADDV